MKKRICSRAVGRCFLVILTVLSLCFTASSCENTDPPMTEYLSSPLDAELTVTANGITCRVTVHLGAVNGENGARDSETVFLSPQSVEGLTAREIAGERTVTLGDMTAPYGSVSDGGLFLPASLFAPGTVVGRETGEENGATCLVLRFGDGRVFSIDPASGQILAIRSGDATATVEWCEIRSAEK